MSGIEQKRKISEQEAKKLLSYGDVEQSFRLVLENGISPFQISAVEMRGMLALRKSEFKVADELIHQAIRMKPDNHIALKMAGDSAFLQTKYSDAEKYYRQALVAAPDSPEIRHDLAVAIVSQGRVQECLQHFQSAIDVAPQRADFHHHLAIMLVLAGQDAAGWDRMQWRLQVPGVCGTFPNPEKYWKGEALEGKTIVLRSEQGWGDTIMFSNYLPKIQEQNPRKIYFYCQRAMMRFLEHYFPFVHAWPNDAPPPLDFDYHVNLMCLPRLMPDGYTPPRARKWRGEGIGVCWFGSPTHKADHLRTVPIEMFGPLSEAAGQKLKCLGYGRFQEQPPFLDYLIDKCHDWLDTAKIVQELDLVVTVDTAIAHLAGFLGVETWMLTPFVPDFRWHTQGETTRWYQSMKLYRQAEVLKWEPVFQRVADDLRARYSSANNSSFKAVAAA